MAGDQMDQVTDSSTPTFAELLRRYRRQAGFTQEELAERSGLSVRGIGDLERGDRHVPRRETVRLLAAALGLDQDELRRLDEAAHTAGSWSSGEMRRWRSFPLPGRRCTPRSRCRSAWRR